MFEEALPHYRAIGLRDRIIIALARSGDRVEAERLFGELADSGEYLDPWVRAEIYVALGETERALDSIEAAYDEGSVGITSMKNWPLLDPLGSEPRFQAVLQRLNFPEVDGAGR